MSFIHDFSGWPDLRWDSASLAAPLAAVRHRQGRLIGRMEALGFPLRMEASLRTLTEDVVTSSAIEGETLDRQQVRSSIARRLGMDIAGLIAADRNVEGVVEMMLDATQRHETALTAERLFAWHAVLFPTGWSDLHRIVAGAWRTARSGPMQVVSGPIGRERVHFEAPKADQLDNEMKRFLNWFDTPDTTLDPVLRAAVAHLWFITIHPFEDGNGRIARAIADMALARSETTSQRFYSMSAQIQADRESYYAILEATQRGGLDITAWLGWFLACLDRAFDRAETLLAGVLEKARFWEAHAETLLNPRQRLMLAKLLDGFTGKLTSSKWAKIAKCSQDTALRDIEDLMNKTILFRQEPAGRSTSYGLCNSAQLSSCAS